MTFAPDLSGTSMGMHGQPVPKSAKKKEQLSEEQLAMRDYAVGEDGRSRTDGTVLLHVSHSNLKNTFFHELRLDMHSTVEAIKRKLEFHTGTSAVCNQVPMTNASCVHPLPCLPCCVKCRHSDACTRGRASYRAFISCSWRHIWKHALDARSQ
jgi:hypothetical protein